MWWRAQVEKDPFVEKSIVQEFSYALHVGLFNVDLTKERRVANIVHLTAYSITQIIMIPCSIVATIKLRDNLNYFSQSLHISLLLVLGIVFVYHVNIRANDVFQYHAIHARSIFDYGQKPSKHVESLTNEMAREKKMLILLPALVVLVGCLLLASIALDRVLGIEKADRINGVNVKLVAPLYTPFDSQEGFAFYFMAAVLGLEVTFTVSSIACASFTYAVGSQRLLLQLQILRWSVLNIEKRASVLSQDSVRDSQESLMYCLKQNIAHYQAIKRYYDLFARRLADFMMLCAFFVGTIVIALSMVVLNKGTLTIGDTISFSCMGFAEVGNMLLLCSYGERISAECENLFQDLYFIRWYVLSPEFKRTLLVFRSVVRKPLATKVGGIVDANLATFSTIMNTAYSYFNLLNAAEKLG